MVKTKEVSKKPSKIEPTREEIIEAEEEKKSEEIRIARLSQ